MPAGTVRPGRPGMSGPGGSNGVAVLRPGGGIAVTLLARNGDKRSCFLRQPVSRERIARRKSGAAGRVQRRCDEVPVILPSSLGHRHGSDVATEAAAIGASLADAFPDAGPAPPCAARAIGVHRSSRLRSRRPLPEGFPKPPDEEEEGSERAGDFGAATNASQAAASGGEPARASRRAAFASVGQERQLRPDVTRGAFSEC